MPPASTLPQSLTIRSKTDRQWQWRLKLRTYDTSQPRESDITSPIALSYPSLCHQKRPDSPYHIKWATSIETSHGINWSILANINIESTFNDDWYVLKFRAKRATARSEAGWGSERDVVCSVQPSPFVHYDSETLRMGRYEFLEANNDGIIMVWERHQTTYQPTLKVGDMMVTKTRRHLQSSFNSYPWNQCTWHRIDTSRANTSSIRHRLDNSIGWMKRRTLYGCFKQVSDGIVTQIRWGG